MRTPEKNDEFVRRTCEASGVPLNVDRATIEKIAQLIEPRRATTRARTRVAAISSTTAATADVGRSG